MESIRSKSSVASTSAERLYRYHGSPHGDAPLRAFGTPNLVGEVKDNTGGALSDVSVTVVQIEITLRFEAACRMFSNRGLTAVSPIVSPNLCHQSTRVSPHQRLTFIASRRWKQQPVSLSSCSAIGKAVGDTIFAYQRLADRAGN